MLGCVSAAAQPINPGGGGGAGGTVNQGTQGTSGSPWFVNCIVGCAGGTSNNNADGVATSATNGQTIAWLYGFNGTTWDRLRDDANKNLVVDLGAAAAITNTGFNALQGGSANVSGNPFFVNVVNANANGLAANSASSPVIEAYNSHASTTALGTSLAAKASAGYLYGFNCTAITGAAAGYCIAYNGTTAPGTGALTGANVLDACYFDTTARGCSLSRIPMGVAYGTGIVILVSSAVTPFTYTTGIDTAFISADYQ